MAQQGPTAALEDELSCPICFEFFQDPVSLKCQHSFCRSCLETPTWIQQKQCECPVCRRRHSMDDLQPSMSNMNLRNIVEAYLQREEKEGSEGRAVGLVVCATHNKKLRFFCEECEKLVCAVCVETELHAKHKYLSVKEEAQWRKRELTSLLYNLPEKLELDIKQARASREHAAQYIKTQAQTTAGHIKSDVNLTSDINSLSERISDIQNRMKTDDVSFLQIYKDLKDSTLQDPEPLSGTLIDVAQHLGNPRFKVWEKMQKMVQYTHVTLDVNSAHADLLISGVLLEVSDRWVSQPVPDNAERFESSVSVLGSVGFCSGIHSWEVEVGPKKAWTLGVAKDNVARKGNVMVSTEVGIWAMGLWNGEQYSAGTAPLGTPLVLKRKPKRIMVKLDYEKGELSFHDSSDMSLIYMFEHRFTERLFPYFFPCLNSDGTNPGVLRICPEKVSVTVTPVH
ncbi:E3 ubiquitin-protein ligase TRIM21-like [Coregonus clupeaformis]|uniref:E3 ubiquitin-protein ligase TRIM21-like n=1 Tax=Coregonus clupeaformis TaxID=59861 RepID=UPI001E1C6EB2|nr:E3 ubiquitin-protein ligase TRIM21-like [Coregonus clupeaformis]